jgi:hypothetical protein
MTAPSSEMITFFTWPEFFANIPIFSITAGIFYIKQRPIFGKTVSLSVSLAELPVTVVSNTTIFCDQTIRGLSG